MRWRILSWSLALAMLGCSSVKTTFVTVSPNGTLIENPDRCIHGVPAVVKVPTHLEVAIVQTDFLKVEGDPSQKRLVPLPAATLRTVSIQEIQTDKVIMLDPKRPASGQGMFMVEYSEDGKGNVTKINYKAVDETLKNSAALATAALKAFGVKPTASRDPNDPVNVVRVEHTIAIQRFPINQCQQGDIEAFVAQYITLCAPSDCQSPTGYAPTK